MSVFRIVPRSEIESRWPELRKLLLPAVEMGSGELEVDDILQLALEGRMHVFADDKFAITVEFIHYPRKIVMLVGFGAGKVTDHKAAAALLRSAAEKIGATSVRTYCKNPAMARYYRRFLGLMKPTYTVLETPL